jgi:hypothetical protein
VDCGREILSPILDTLKDHEDKNYIYFQDESYEQCIDKRITFRFL